MGDEFKAGDVFAGFRIIRELGKGAMGIVYLAFDPELKKDVALKTILPSALRTAADPLGIISRFHREAKLATTIKHKNVVEAFKSGEENGTCYLACEFVEGSELASLLKKPGTCLEAAHALEITKDILEGLLVFEATAIIHRDIKPENILLTKTGEVKISDLGLARQEEGTMFTVEGDILGTPRYMAPEQILGSLDLDSRCDIYSVGAMLFHLIVGRPPFQAKRLTRLLKLHLRDPIPDICALMPSLPREIGLLIRSFMAKEREDRPRNVSEAIKQVEACLPLVQAKQSLMQTLLMVEETMKTMPLEDRGLALPLVEQMPEAVQPRRRRLEALGVASDCLRQARLKIIGEDGRRADLFLYAQEKLQLGRNAVGQNGQDLCLRHRPAAGNEQKIRNISGKHFGVFGLDGCCWIRDLGSSCGTQLNGVELPKETSYPLEQVNEVIVAGNLRLKLTAVPVLGDALELGAMGPIPQCPSLFIQRVSNDESHAYAMVGTTLGFMFSSSGQASQTAIWPGDMRVFNLNGGLWILDPQNPSACRPISDGMRISIGGMTIYGSQLRPEHQK
ncbi:MAG: FHA domain-containing serine/threonine-protein kinase [Planctomycetota bacterium]|nr:FHA domain-containing serine/threonine-protein kinase [Planctomycetota bacterium]